MAAVTKAAAIETVVNSIVSRFNIESSLGCDDL